MLDAATGQQTAATVLLENRVSRAAREQDAALRDPAVPVGEPGPRAYLPHRHDDRVEGDNASRKRALQIHLALTDLKSGTVVAQASALAKDEGLDHTPLAYYRDSPVLVKDKVIEGYARTSATPPGQRGDAFYLERIAAATVINEATALYNQERYVEALGQYRSALAMPTGEQIRVMNGIYLTTAKLGRTAEAEQAFGRVVALGIAYNELGVKFLFNPGSTDFWSDTG
jgi:tetratricopeptide (TPR) repeat protein